MPIRTVSLYFRTECESISSIVTVKYIALLAMVKIVPSHPHLVAEYQDMILASVDDQDISIRMRALDLVSAMVSYRRYLYPAPNDESFILGQQRQSSINSPTDLVTFSQLRYILHDPSYSSTIPHPTYNLFLPFGRETYFSTHTISCLPTHSLPACPRHMLSRHV